MEHGAARRAVRDAGRDGPGAGDPHSGATTPSTVPRALVLVSADWSLPSRPAPTVLRELARRPGPPVRALLIEDPERDALDALGVSVLPTWMVLAPVSGSGASDASAGRAGETRLDALDGDVVLTDLVGNDPGGEPLRLEGPWRVLRRSEGALPKHAVAALLDHEGPVPS